MTDTYDKPFYTWPTDPKPPIVYFPIRTTPIGPIEDMKNMHRIYSESIVPPDSSFFIKPKSLPITGWEIQVALSGFSDKDIEVYNQNNILHIKGDNTHRHKDVSNKFINSFHYQIHCVEALYLSNSKVEFINGLLRIKIPIQEKADQTSDTFSITTRDPN